MKDNQTQESKNKEKDTLVTIEERVTPNVDIVKLIIAFTYERN